MKMFLSILLSLLLSACMHFSQPSFKGTYFALEACKRTAFGITCNDTVNISFDLQVLPSRDTVILMKDVIGAEVFRLKNSRVYSLSREKQVYQFDAHDVMTGKDYDLTLVYHEDTLVALHFRELIVDWVIYDFYIPEESHV